MSLAPSKPFFEFESRLDCATRPHAHPFRDYVVLHFMSLHKSTQAKLYSESFEINSNNIACP